MSEENNERIKHDHTCHATVKFAGDPRGGFWWISVLFKNNSEIDELIRLLTDLRDNPEAQQHHIHFQDHRMCEDHPEHCHASEDAEISFFAPNVERNPDIYNMIGLLEGAHAMRAFWQPPPPLGKLPEEPEE